MLALGGSDAAEAAVGEMVTVNERARLASRMKSATSVESAHCSTRPRGVVLRNETVGVAGASDARMRRATCERGWDGCKRKTMGGGASPFGRASPRGRMSLKRWEDVGDSFPVVHHEGFCEENEASTLCIPLPSVTDSKSSLDSPLPKPLSGAASFHRSLLDASAINRACPTFVFSVSCADVTRLRVWRSLARNIRCVVHGYNAACIGIRTLLCIFVRRVI